MLKAHANPNSTSDLVVRVTGYSAFFSSGEKLDLICVLFDGGPGIYVNKGQLLELDELFEKYGADVEAAEGVAMAGGYFNGKLYAIPDEEFMGRRYGFVGRQDILDKYEFDEYEDATYEDLDAFFARVKVGEREDFYIFNNVGGVSTIGNFMLTLPLYHGGRKALLHAVPGVHDRGHMRLGETAVMECLKRANRLYQVSCHGERFFLKLFPGEAAVYLAGRPDSVSAQEEHESTYRNMDAAIQADLGTWQTPDCIVRISLAEYRNPETFYMVEDVENALLSQTHSIPLDFSGMIRYETEWDMTGEELGILHLGQCREAARVWVNGRDVGVRMGYPYYYEMADAWVPGRNRIRVEVPTTLAHALCDCFSRNMVVVSEGLDGPMQFK